MRNGLFASRICLYCHKKFIKPKENLYKITHGGTVYHCCSYTCFQECKKLKQARDFDALDKLAETTKALQWKLED